MRQALGRIARATVGFACLLWFEAGVAGAGEAVLSGTVAYRERIALPSGAVVEIKLLDVSRMDVAAEVMAETAIRPDHQVPIPFELVYDLTGSTNAAAIPFRRGSWSTGSSGSSAPRRASC